MAGVEYRYVIVNYHDRKPLAELDLTNVSYTRAVNDHNSLTATFGIYEDDATTQLLSPWSTCLAVYRGDNCDFFGPLITAAKDNGSDGLTLTYAGISSLLTRRYIRATGFGTSDVQVSKNQGDWLTQVLASLQTPSYNNVGFTVAYTISGSDHQVLYSIEPTDDKTFADMLGDFTQLVNGIEWYVTTSNDLLTHTIHVGSPRVGVTKPQVVFDWDRNITDYGWQWSGASLANDIVYRGDGSPPIQITATATDTTLYNPNAGTPSQPHLEAALSNSSVMNTPLAQSKANAALTVLKKPYQFMTGVTVQGTGTDLEPMSTRYKEHYDIGDSVKAIVHQGYINVEGTYRIWSMDIQPAVTGLDETVAITFRDEAETLFSA